MDMRVFILGLSVCLVACGSTTTGEETPDPVASAGGAGTAGSDSAAGGASLGSGGGAAGSSTEVSGHGGSTGGGGGAKAAGGASGAGGALGSGGSVADAGAPHVVATCPMGNGAPGKVGVWENITPAGIAAKKLSTPGGAILVNPKDTRVVYAGSANGGGLYKSTDCGATFEHVNTGKGASDIDSGNIWDMVIDPVDPDVLYVIEGYGHGGLWKTTNGGVDWVNTTPEGSEVAKTANYNFTSIVGMDITDPQHLVVAFHSGCSGAYAPNCQAETKDGGATWRLFKEPIAGEGVGVIVLNATTWISGGYNEMFETTDSGVTWNKVSTTTAHWQLYRSPSGTLYIGTQQGILSSTDGKSWSLIPGFNQQVQGITGDGTNIYAGQQWGSKLFKIPEANPKGMTELPPTDGNNDGPYFMSMDVDHHIVYASEFQSGHWRMVTQ
jgi:hypothetical protein